LKTLPFRAATSSGDVFNIDFPLHSETGDAVRVGQLISAILEAIDRDIAVVGETSNGDVLQAAAMALAVRARMIHAPRRTTERLTAELVAAALQAVAAAQRETPQTGHA
jgi:hypothetical protein